MTFIFALAKGVGFIFIGVWAVWRSKIKLIKNSCLSHNKIADYLPRRQAQTSSRLPGHTFFTFFSFSRLAVKAF
jgi:hypothetical protein